MEKIIIVEADENLRNHLERQLRQLNYHVASAATLASAQEWLNKDRFELVLAGAQLPDGPGTDLLPQLQSQSATPLVVILADPDSVKLAVDGVLHGAFDYVLKPFSDYQMEATLQKAEDHWRLLQVNQVLSRAGDADSGSELSGPSLAMEQLRQSLRKIARTHATLLIRGESGSGKGLVARAFYRQSPRAKAPFIEADCAAIPENLIESELFGYGKKPVPGASARREGLFALAHGGTLLLDEIGALSFDLQGRLLRVLQQQELERAGGQRAIPVDVRVIATTSRHLEDMVKRNEFREDLFHRLNIVPIHVPPLRERRDDIPLLADQFRQRYARKHGKDVLAISPGGMNLLQAQPWPGNVRELQFVMERAVIACADGGVLEPVHFGFASGESSSTKSTAAGSKDSPAGAAEIDALSEVEKKHIFVVLEKCHGNRTHAARRLGISIRTLRNKLKEYRADSSAQSLEASVEVE